MIIREATAADFHAIAAVGQHFYETTAYRDIPYSPESMLRWLPIMRQQRLLYVADDAGRIVGGIGGLFAPLYFNDSHRIAQEMFWWVEPDYRTTRAAIRLLRAIELGVSQAGCSWLSMLLLEGENAERIEKFYLCDGYRPSERAFTKVMSCQPQPQL
jgi:hypothetical protein